jgi:hypothetical protein
MNTNHIIAKVSEIFSSPIYLPTYFGNFYVCEVLS